MELNIITHKIGNMLSKYRYVALILVTGIVLIFLPFKNNDRSAIVQETVSEPKHLIETEILEKLLQTIQGAGNVKVMLSVAYGEETIYQKDTDISASDGNSSTRNETIVITNSERNENGLIRQVNPPVYLGAIVICEGADDANVRLSITQAVSKITGLSTDHICVLKMK